MMVEDLADGRDAFNVLWRPVRSLATNRKPAVGGQRGGDHCDGASVRFLPSARQRRSNCAGGTYPNDECLRSVL